ncbi:MAG: low molecular weight protein-tyrosine-phosphatase [Nocardioidaceae bacterium]
MPTLPPPHTATPYAIAMVCLGNICRSPMAATVMSAKLAHAGMDGAVVVHSAGTGDWHVGEPMDVRAAATVAAAGYDPSDHRAATFDVDWFDCHDLVLAMDSDNRRDLAAMARDELELSRVQMFRSFDAGADDLDVPDPWYGGALGFERVLAMVERTTDQIVAELTRDPVLRLES